MKRLLIPLLTATGLIIGCAPTVTETALKNDKGETRYCYLTNDYTSSSMGAFSQYTRCLNEAGTAGFRKID